MKTSCFKMPYQWKDMEALSCEEKDFPEPLLWHIYSLMIFDRLSSDYAKYEYLDQFGAIEYFHKRDKFKMNRVKYVFAFHQTQLISLAQLFAISRMLQGIEQNNYEYLKYAAKFLIQSNIQRVFIKVLRNHQYITPNIYQIFLRL
ncbi:unnamed protein product [Paramecium primaurelia]|nr:unnamed protein product [Paramecium primaurelia]